MCGPLSSSPHHVLCAAPPGALDPALGLGHSAPSGPSLTLSPLARHPGCCVGRGLGVCAGCTVPLGSPCRELTGLPCTHPVQPEPRSGGQGPGRVFVKDRANRRVLFLSLKRRTVHKEEDTAYEGRQGAAGVPREFWGPFQSPRLLSRECGGCGGAQFRGWVQL